MTEFKIGDKCWVQYEGWWKKGKVVGVTDYTYLVRTRYVLWWETMSWGKARVVKR